MRENTLILSPALLKINGKMPALLVIMLLVMSMVSSITTSLYQPKGSENSEDFPQKFSQNATGYATGQFGTVANAVYSNGAVRLSNENLTPPAWSGHWNNFGMFSSNLLQFREPFNALRAEWLAGTPARTAIEVDVRASRDGQQWTFWEVLNKSGQVAAFDSDKLYLFAEYRVRLFSADEGVSPEFLGIDLLANRLDFQQFNSGNNNINALALNAAPSSPPPTYSVFGTRQGMVGGRTANGYIIEERARFVSLPSWKSLNNPGKKDYQVKITANNGRSGIAPVWDVGPWSHKDNYWTAPRERWNDLPVGVPMAEKAFFENYNGGKNEYGDKIVNPSSIDIGDGTWWDDLGLKGAGWRDGDRLAVTFLWAGTITPIQISNVTASDVGSGNARIKWTTNVPTNPVVEYGFDTNYGFSTKPGNQFGNEHNIYLFDLAPNRTYYFRVKSTDIYGQEAYSQAGTFKTSSGMTTVVTPWVNDKGLKVEIAPDFGTITIAGKREVDSYWNDNPVENFTAGTSTEPGNVGNAGGLDVEFAPVCDAKGQNCSYGSGSGYKAYVQLVNDKGEEIRVGVIADGIISPNGLTIMVEGTTKNGPIWRYSQPNLLPNDKSHHFLIVWDANTVRVKVNYGDFLEPVPVTTSGIKWNFVGAARYKGDGVNVSFKEINFSWGSVNPAPPPEKKN